MKTKREAFKKVQEMYGIESSLAFFQYLDDPIEDSEHENLIKLMTPFYKGEIEVKKTSEEQLLGETTISDFKFIKIYLETLQGLMPIFIDVEGSLQTLNDIHEKFKNQAEIIYVVCYKIEKGIIYRCGNSEPGIWDEYAITKGYP
ncbi:hypothetical protein ACQKTA_12060 (plasmid) [Enterococcus sp. 22-H-5-01]|uniref:hypothetical protein n=1 Tax=Enterococcus sp. 22-H-5-01 TaxID=3418555 RepID=UPI003D078AA6